LTEAASDGAVFGGAEGRHTLRSAFAGIADARAMQQTAQHLDVDECPGFGLQRSALWAPAFTS